MCALLPSGTAAEAADADSADAAADDADVVDAPETAYGANVVLILMSHTISISGTF